LRGEGLLFDAGEEKRASVHDNVAREVGVRRSRKEMLFQERIRRLEQKPPLECGKSRKVLISRGEGEEKSDDI